jgi:hypothetical protein
MNNDQLQRAKNTLWAEVNRNIARTEDDKPGFVLDENNTPVLRELAHHMVKGPCQWLDQGCGIAIVGPVGTFKTEMMKAYGRTLIRGGGEGFQEVSALVLEKLYSRSSKDESSNGGAKVVLKYGELPRDLCIHDIGEEPQGQHFGAPCDVIGEIISMRYVLWKERGVLTHITTNIIDEDGLNAKYDPRIVRRMLEMMRWMPLGGPDRSAGAKPVNRKDRELFAAEPPMPSEEELERSRLVAEEGFRRVRETLKRAKEELASPTAMVVVPKPQWGLPAPVEQPQKVAP